MDLSLFGQSRDAEGRRPAAHPGLGPWVGARVASPRCPILRPGSSNLLRSTATRQFTAGPLPTLLQLSDSGSRTRGPDPASQLPRPLPAAGFPQENIRQARWYSLPIANLTVTRPCATSISSPDSCPCKGPGGSNVLLSTPRNAGSTSASPIDAMPPSGVRNAAAGPPCMITSPSAGPPHLNFNK